MAADFTNFSVVKIGPHLVVEADVDAMSAGDNVWNIQWKRGTQTWSDVVTNDQFYSVSCPDIASPVSGFQILVLFDLAVSVTFRMQQVGGIDYDFQYFNYVSPAEAGLPAVVATPYSRQFTYKNVRDALINRRGIQSPNAAELERIAQFITAANRQSLQGYAFGEQWITMSVDCDNGKVLWADIYGADHREFFTADPRPANSCARCIAEKQPDADGVWLDSGSATTVWAKFVPRFPEFTNVDMVDATSYGQGATGFVDATGHCYECIAVTGALGSEYADTSKWRPLPLLWLIKEPIIGFAESLLAERSQQYGSAASIHARAMDTLGTLQTKDLEKYQTR